MAHFLIHQVRSVRRLSLGAVFGLGLLLGTAANAAEDPYTAGLSAFINKDYELAQSYWIQAAKNDHSRAMFNLGLLHQQGHLANSDPAKAKRWYRLAGQAGYAAADYHHALWLMEDGSARVDVLELLHRSDANGYKPASDRLRAMGVKTGSTQSGVNDVNAGVVGVSNASAATGYFTESWLKARPGEHWTIQLLAFTEETKVQAFIEQHELHDQAAYFAEQSRNGRFFKLVYGEYQSKEEANLARSGLTQELKEHGPWLRSMGSIHAVLEQ